MVEVLQFFSGSCVSCDCIPLLPKRSANVIPIISLQRKKNSQNLGIVKASLYLVLVSWLYLNQGFNPLSLTPLP